MLHLQFGLYQIILKNFIHNAEQSAFDLKNAIIKDDIDETVIAMCSLGKSCGTCHANFRRLLTSQLK